MRERERERERERHRDRDRDRKTKWFFEEAIERYWDSPHVADTSS